LGNPLSVTGKPKREVLLPSQEVKKGAMQYALYVANPAYLEPKRSRKRRRGCCDWEADICM
jgi:hypothetical protein